MKRTIALILAVVMIFALAGLAHADDKPFDGVTLSVLGNSSNASTYMQEHLAEFEEETGIHVEYEQLTNDQLNSKILVSMAAGGTDLDVFMFQAFQTTKMFVNNGWLEPLDQFITEDFDIGDYQQGTIDASSVDGKLYGIPHGSEYTIIFYNKNMINEAGIDVDAIKTWDDLIAACATVEEKLPGKHGIALRGQGNGAVTMVICLAYAYGGDYFDEEGNAAINSEAWVKACEKYTELLKYAQEGASTMSWSETCNVFAQLQTAFRMDADSQYHYLIDPESSLVSTDEIGFFCLPAGDVRAATTLGNWSIGMSSGSENKEAAWEFLRWMNTKEACLDAALEQTATPARNSVLENEQIKSLYPAGYTETTIGSGAIAFGGPLPNMSYSTEARTALGEALDNIFLGGDAQEELDIANEVMQELLDEEAAEA